LKGSDKMAQRKNTWGLYKWFKEDGEHLIFPSDLERFMKFQAKSILFYCIDEDDQYITIKYKDETFRVKPELYKQVPTPKFKYGDKVKMIENPEIEAIIDNILWHYDRNEPMYFIVVNGKRKSKRYWETDFIPL